MAEKKPVPSDKEDDEKEERDPPLRKTDREEDADDDEGDDDDLIPVRRSSLVAKDHIIARQKRKIEKLGEGKDKNEGKDDEEGDDKEADEDRIVSRVSKIVEPIRKHLASREDEDELRKILDDKDGHPFAEELEKKMRKYMEHPAYANVPVESIYRTLAFEKAAGQRVERKKAADLEARHSRSGGHQRRPVQSSNKIAELDNLEDMSDEEHARLVQRAKSGEFVE